MKKLSMEQMEVTSAGLKLNYHTWQEHLICIGWGALASPGGPLSTAGAMILCYASS